MSLAVVFGIMDGALDEFERVRLVEGGKDGSGYGSDDGDGDGDGDDGGDDDCDIRNGWSSWRVERPC